MIIRLTTTCIVLPVTMLALLAAAPGFAGNDRAAASHKLIEAAALDTFLANYADDVFGGIVAAAPNLAETDSLRVHAVVNRFYDANVLRRSIVRRFASMYDEIHAEIVFAWMREPLFRKIHAVEVEATSPDSADELTAHLEAFDASKFDPTRRRLLVRLDWFQKSSEFAADMTSDASIATTMGAASVSNSETDVRMAQYRYQLHAQRAGFVKHFRAANVGSNSFVYRSLTNEELKAYIEFSATPAGEWYSDALRHAVGDALREASLSFGREMAKFTAKAPRPSDDQPSAL